MGLKAMNHLVSHDWLALNFDASALQIAECRSQLPNYFDESATDGLDLARGRPLFDEAIFPGRLMQIC